MIAVVKLFDDEGHYRGAHVLDPSRINEDEISTKYVFEFEYNQLNCSKAEDKEGMTPKELNEMASELIQKVKVEFMNEDVVRSTEKETEIDRAYARGWNNCQSAILSNISEAFMKDAESEKSDE